MRMSETFRYKRMFTKDLKCRLLKKGNLTIQEKRYLYDIIVEKVEKYIKLLNQYNFYKSMTPLFDDNFKSLFENHIIRTHNIFTMK